MELLRLGLALDAKRSNLTALEQERLDMIKTKLHTPTTPAELSEEEKARERRALLNAQLREAQVRFLRAGKISPSK